MRLNQTKKDEIHAQIISDLYSSSERSITQQISEIDRSLYMLWYQKLKPIFAQIPNDLIQQAQTVGVTYEYPTDSDDSMKKRNAEIIFEDPMPGQYSWNGKIELTEYVTPEIARQINKLTQQQAKLNQEKVNTAKCIQESFKQWPTTAKLRKNGDTHSPVYDLLCELSLIYILGEGNLKQILGEGVSNTPTINLDSVKQQMVENMSESS